MSNSCHRLTYFPVNTVCDKKTFEKHGVCLTNALKPIAESKLSEINKKNVMTDSGGLQIVTLGLNRGKSILLGSIYEHRFTVQLQGV